MMMEEMMEEEEEEAAEAVVGVVVTRRMKPFMLRIRDVACAKQIKLTASGSSLLRPLGQDGGETR